MKTTPLPKPTGERFLPGHMGGFIELEHLSRYLLAREIIHNLNVLDIACGEGYGSYMLSHVAATVTGVDISSKTISEAKEKYTRENLTFKEGNTCNIPLPNASVDAVISFETIEHHDKHIEMIQEIKRVLKPNGFLLISSPDKEIVTDRTGVDNPYHIKELYKKEFQCLMQNTFKKCKFAGQRVLQGALIFWEDENKGLHLIPKIKSPTLCESLQDAPYCICIASDTDLPVVNNLFLETRENLFKTTLKGLFITIVKKTLPEQIVKFLATTAKKLLP